MAAATGRCATNAVPARARLPRCCARVPHTPRRANPAGQLLAMRFASSAATSGHAVGLAASAALGTQLFAGSSKTVERFSRAPSHSSQTPLVLYHVRSRRCARSAQGWLASRGAVGQDRCRCPRRRFAAGPPPLARAPRRPNRSPQARSDLNPHRPGWRAGRQRLLGGEAGARCTCKRRGRCPTDDHRLLRPPTCPRDPPVSFSPTQLFCLEHGIQPDGQVSPSRQPRSQTTSGRGAARTQRSPGKAGGR